MKPWPALWPPTLATKSQKPRPERWPLTDPSLPLCAALPTQPASGQRLVASLCSQQTAVSSLPTSCLPSKQIARASHPFPARDCPRAKLWSNRRSCALKRRTYLQLLALKSLQPWPQLWPSLKVVTAVGPSPASSRHEERVWLPSARNFGFKPVLQLSRGKRFCDSARSSCSARLALARKSLQPSLELSSAARSRRNCHSQPSTPRRPARASRSCDTLLLRMWCHSAKQRGRRAPTQPASGQRLVASLCSQQTAVSSLPTSCLPSKQIARASHPFPARDCPRAKLWSNRRSCALKRRTYLQLLALKSLQPWPQLWPIAQSCYSRRPLAGLKQTRRACVAPKRAQLWVQASAATFTRQTLLRLSSLQLQRSASASEEIAAAFA